MKTLILLFVITMSLQAQYLTGKKILFYVSTTTSSIFSGVTEGMQQREQHMPISSDEKMRLNKAWHVTQTFERASWIGTGISVALDSDFNFWKILSDLSVTASIHWMVYDGLENFYRDKPFFWVSDFQREHNTSLTDKYSTWQFKVVAVIVTIGINYLIYVIF